MSDTWPPGFTLSLTRAFPADFPNLKPASLSGTFSPFDFGYNCFAWAASVTTCRWDPTTDDGYWPTNVAELTVPAIIAAYASVGYEPCDNSNIEEGFEKIAIYVNAMDKPTHAARQLRNGLWTTKFGDFEDVTHIDLKCLNGPIYGRPRIFLRRNIAVS